MNVKKNPRIYPEISSFKDLIKVCEGRGDKVAFKLLSGCAYGASVSTASAAYASVSVDNVLVITLGDAAGVCFRSQFL